MTAISNADPRDAYRDRIVRLLLEKLDNDESTRESIAGIKEQMKNNDLTKTDIAGVLLRAKQDLAAIKRERKPADKQAELETVEQVAAALGPFADSPLASAAIQRVRERVDG